MIPLQFHWTAFRKLVLIFVLLYAFRQVDNKREWKRAYSSSWVIKKNRNSIAQCSLGTCPSSLIAIVLPRLVKSRAGLWRDYHQQLRSFWNGVGWLCQPLNSNLLRRWGSEVPIITTGLANMEYGTFLRRYGKKRRMLGTQAGKTGIEKRLGMLG